MIAATEPGGGATSGTTVAERYRSLFVIGRGGMGSVEVALERVERGGTEFARVVALKRLLPEAARDPRHVEMFLREARLAALLNHPNVVHAFDFGELHGELFLAMEYVEGDTLAHVIRAAFEKEGRFAPALVAHVLAEICDGLHAAHELCDVSGAPLNVVHRDVSPHNVMVAYEGHVRLLDFGVAKIEDGRGLTNTGEVKGKTAYMSPEQAMGEQLDRRSDLYSVGAVLFECLAGRRMWGDGTDMETIRRLALEEPPRLDESVPGTPKRLCELHARLVAKSRDDRPNTAREVSDALRAFIAETGTRPDARVMRAVMTRLFTGEAEARKRHLNDALSDVVSPGTAESLRATLGSGAVPRSHDAVSAFAPTVPGARDADLADSTSAVIAPAPRVGRSRVLAVAGTTLALGALVTALALGRTSRPLAPPAAPAPVTGAPPIATLATSTVDPIPIPAPTTDRSAAPGDASLTPKRSSTKAAARPATKTVLKPLEPSKPITSPSSISPSRASPPPPPPTRPLDVDPNAVP